VFAVQAYSNNFVCQDILIFLFVFIVHLFLFLLYYQKFKNIF